MLHARMDTFTSSTSMFLATQAARWDTDASVDSWGSFGRNICFCLTWKSSLMFPKRSKRQPDPNRQESEFWIDYCPIKWMPFGGTTVWVQNDVLAWDFLCQN